MAGLMHRTGSFRLPDTGRTHFAALAESIHHQQPAGAAAVEHRKQTMTAL